MNSAISTTTILLDNQQFIQLQASLGSIATVLRHHAFWDTQIFAALLGASIGLIPFGYLLFLDRPRIKVKTDHVWISSGPDTIVLSGFSATISNAGRRPIIVDKVYLKFEDESAILFASENNFATGVSGLPRELRENTSHTIHIFASTISHDLLKLQKYPASVCFSDALGREYKASTDASFWDKVFEKPSTISLK